MRIGAFDGTHPLTRHGSVERTIRLPWKFLTAYLNW